MAAYDGFISYSHAADGALAPALHDGLRRLAKPWNRRSALHIFRDQTGLSTSPHLWSSIERALDSANWFVLLASPEAAQSEWVNRELAHWLAGKSEAHILPVVTDGTWEWKAGQLSGTAIPAVLASVFVDEPRHLDLRWARTETELDLRHSMFRGAVADLAAPMHGIAKDELEGEDVRQHRRVRRLTRSAVGALAILLIMALAAATFAVAQRNRADEAAGTAREQATEARRQATIANAERLSALALAEADTRLDQALLLAAEGYRLHDNVSTRRALLTVLTTNDAARLERTLHNLPPGVIAGDLSPDGELGMLSVGDGTLHFLDARKFSDITAPVQVSPQPYTAVFSPDSALVATGAVGGLISFWDPRSGRRVGPQISGGALVPAGRLGVLGFGKGHGVLASADTDGNAVRFFSTVTGAELAVPVAMDAPLDLEYRADGGAVAVGGPGHVVVIDATTMQATHDLSASGSTIAAVALSSDGRWAVGGDDLGQLHVWDLANGGAAHIVQASDQAILDIAANPLGGDMATSGSERTIQRWGFATLDAIGPPITGFREAPRGLLYADDDSLLTLAPTEVTKWDLSTRALSTLLPDIRMSRSGPPGRVLVLDQERHVLQIFDPATRRGTGVEIAVQSMFAAAGLDAGTGRYAYVVTRRAGAPSDVSVYAVHTGAVVDRSELPLGMTVENLSPDGRTMLLRPDGASTETHYACCDVVWDVHTGDELTKPTAPGLFRFGAFAGSFTAEGGMVLWGQNGPDQSIVRTLDTKGVATARYDEVGVAGTPEDPRLRVVAGPGGLIAVTGGNGQVQLLRAPSLRPIGGPFFTETVSALAFSSDGSLLATASGSNVTLWDVETHQQLGTLDVGTDVDNVALIGGDHPFLLTSADDQVYAWDLEPTHWSSLACALAGRQLTQHEWRVNMGDTPYRPVCAA